MQVAQRGTSATGVNSNGFYACDRFEYSEGSGGGSGALTISQVTDSPDGFGNSLKLEVTTTDTLTAGENVGIRHRIEGQNVQHLAFGSSSAKTITVSFWVKSTLTGTYGLQVFSAGGTRDILKAYTISVADVWEYKTLTFVGDTNTAIANDVNRGLELYFPLDAGANDIFDPYTWASTAAFRAPTGQVNFMATNGAKWKITGVQLEVGDTATPFEHRSYGDELAKCQRYYEKIYLHDTYRLNGVAWSTESQNISFPFTVTKRVPPSLSVPSIGQVFTGSWVTPTLAEVTGATINGGTLNIKKTGSYTVKYGYFIRYQDIRIDAEL
jgi:hypothetical protein